MQITILHSLPAAKEGSCAQSGGGSVSSQHIHTYLHCCRGRECCYKVFDWQHSAASHIRDMCQHVMLCRVLEKLRAASLYRWKGEIQQSLEHDGCSVWLLSGLATVHGAG